MLGRFQSSGDLIADRRFLYAAAFLEDGDFAAAAELFEQAIEIAPEWTAAYWSLGKARRDAGDIARAAIAFRECLRLDPEDLLGASLALAEIDASVTIDAAPQAYLKTLFDAYAEDFDSSLVERLDYATPQQLAALVREAGRGETRYTRALDLGCGTGLAGEAIINNVAWLEGVDLSDRMIEKARAKRIYDTLAAGDILTALHSARGRYDLVIAADVLIYFGELEKIFAAIARRLEFGGLVAFSVEKGEGADRTLRASLRFAHSAEYVARVLKSSGLELVRMEERVLRKDRGEDIAGYLVLARRPADGADRSLPADDGAMMDAPASLH
ncbi:MAG: methyltransferase domain-containing protein [Parvularculaceae bacterium]|nr:methyltransferase domain-containing protein [Parvularculaceae bacterium]